jgi:hypothetical protein
MSDFSALLTLLFQVTTTSPAALTAQANKLYRSKQYELACPLFERVTELTPERASAWGDYGLCLARLGKRQKDAVDAEYRAITLSRDVSVRKAAYYNLGHFLGQSFPSHVPGPTEEGTLADLEGELPRCELFDALPGCAERVWACYQDTGPTLGRFGRDPGALAKQSFPESEWRQEPEPVLAGDVLVMKEESSESTRSGLTFCFYTTSCRVVWADACRGRIGYTCDLAQGPDISELAQSGIDGDSPCTPLPAVSGELKLR